MARHGVPQFRLERADELDNMLINETGPTKPAVAKGRDA